MEQLKKAVKQMFQWIVNMFITLIQIKIQKRLDYSLVKYFNYILLK